MSVRRLAEAFNQEAGAAGTCTQAFLDVVGGTNQVITCKVVIDGVAHTLQTPVHKMSDDGYEEVRKLARALKTVKPPTGASGGLVIPSAPASPAPAVTAQHDQPAKAETQAAPEQATGVQPPPAPAAVIPPVQTQPPIPQEQRAAPVPSAPAGSTEGRSGRKAPTADQLPNPFFE